MTVSTGVVILDFNQGMLTTRCLHSLEHGTQLPTLVILVENGARVPEDPALERLPVVRLHPGRNLGCAGGRNFGVNYLVNKTDICRFVVLDNDTVVAPDFVQRAAALPLRPLEVAAPVILDFVTNEIWSCGGTITADGSIEQLTCLSHIGPSDQAEVDWSPGACLIMSRQTWASIGPFDSWLNFLFEDIDWCVRLRRAGGRVVIDRNLHLLHQAHQSLGGYWSPTRVKFWARNGTVFRLTRVNPGLIANVGWLLNEARLALRDLCKARPAWTVARLSGLADGLLESSRRRLCARSDAHHGRRQLAEDLRPDQ